MANKRVGTSGVQKGKRVQFAAGAKAAAQAQLLKDKIGLNNEVLSHVESAYLTLEETGIALDKYKPLRADAVFNPNRPADLGLVARAMPHAVNLFNSLMATALGGAGKAKAKAGGHIQMHHACDICTEDVRRAFIFALMKLLIGWEQLRIDHRLNRVSRFIDEVGELDDLFIRWDDEPAQPRIEVLIL